MEMNIQLNYTLGRFTPEQSASNIDLLNQGWLVFNEQILTPAGK
jgi:hypothetical protein